MSPIHQQDSFPDLKPAILKQMVFISAVSDVTATGFLNISFSAFTAVFNRVSPEVFPFKNNIIPGESIK